MSIPPSRRSAARASSVSSPKSTPTSRRRNSNATIDNNSINTPLTPTRTLRRLQSRSKTVKWTQSINNENDHDESTMSSDHIDDEMTPATILNSLSLSQPNHNNNNSNDNDNNNNNNNNTNNDDNMTIDQDSPVISDEDEEDDQHDANIINDPQKQNNTVKQIEVLIFFDESGDGLSYTCKLCQAV